MSSFLIPVELASGEPRVAASPETVKKLISFGFQVLVEQGAGISAGFADHDYVDVGG